MAASSTCIFDQSIFTQPVVPGPPASRLSKTMAIEPSRPAKQMFSTSTRAWEALTPPLAEWILQAIHSQGFKRMTPVQASTIPLFAGNKDVGTLIGCVLIVGCIPVKDCARFFRASGSFYNLSICFHADCGSSHSG